MKIKDKVKVLVKGQERHAIIRELKQDKVKVDIYDNFSDSYEFNRVIKTDWFEKSEIIL